MKKMTVVFRDEELYHALKVQAAAEGHTLGSAVIEAVTQWLEAKEDFADAASAQEAMREQGENVPWEKVREEIRNLGPPN